MGQNAALDNETVVRFLSAPVPRQVPAPLRRAALSQAAPLGLLLFGAVFLLAGIFFSGLFLPWRQLDQWRLDAGPSEVSRGRIVSVERTGLSINKQTVMRYGFEFTSTVGEPMRGACFTTGRRWTEGEPVNVRYLAVDPALACPQGARLSQASLASSFVVLFPLAGGAILIWTVRSRRRVDWLLRQGMLAEFRVEAIDPTRVSVNNLPQFKVRLVRVDAPDAKPHEVRWHQVAILDFLRARKESGHALFGLIDPAKPNKILLPETWPARG